MLCELENRFSPTSALQSRHDNPAHFDGWVPELDVGYRRIDTHKDCLRETKTYPAFATGAINTLFSDCFICFTDIKEKRGLIESTLYIRLLVKVQYPW